MLWACRNGCVWCWLLSGYSSLNLRRRWSWRVFQNCRYTVVYSISISLYSEIALGISNLIAAHAVHVTLQWIPGHCNISGNEKADKLAKIGATKPQKIPPCTQNTIRQILKNNEKEDWLNRWACGSTERVMFKEMAQPRPQDAINQLDRQDQSLIFEFRTQHTRTNQHLNRIIPLHQPHCRHCDNPAETTEHLLLYCPNLQSKRKELLPTKPTIHSTLYGQLDQLKKTSTFIRLALTVQEWRTQQFGINNNNTTTSIFMKGLTWDSWFDKWYNWSMDRF